jgi:hypothetical protein
MHMRRSVLVLALVLTAGAIVAGTLALRPAPQANVAAAAQPRRTAATEQQWIVGDVVAAIAGIAGMDHPTIDVASPSETRFVVTVADASDPVALDVVEHLWTADTFEPIARRLLSPTSSTSSIEPVDLNARSALTDLTVNTLLGENDRISAVLQQDGRSAAAHESAALLDGAFALRESASVFNDLRPALSRMAAHLAVAKVLRGSAAESRDGAYARAVMTTLAGLQRKALLQIAELERGAPTDVERAWGRALRLRNTGDWRAVDRSTATTRLEQWEYARALRSRHGLAAFLDYLEGGEPDDSLAWHRIVFDDLMKGFSVEAGHRFADDGVNRELAEAASVWGRYHGGNAQTSMPALIAALNDRPASSPIARVDGRVVVQVLDWGTWAAFHQRHLCATLASETSHLHNLGDDDRIAENERSMEAAFGRLALFPIVARWGAPNAEIYQHAMERARPLVETAPELVTHASMNVLLYKPAFTVTIKPFPLQVAWFTPTVPAGTALDLFNRSLRPGCPRPPTRAQARFWAVEQPYDHWTVWAEAFLAMDRGSPSYAVVRKAFGSLVEYDIDALEKFRYLDMSTSDRLDMGERLCRLSPDHCGTLASWALVNDRERDALSAYERWIGGARDRVNVSNHVTWISRYYLDHGQRARAEAIAKEAADTGSYAGMETYAELLDRIGRGDEAEPLYRQIAVRYSNDTVPLGGFLMRRAFRTHDAALEARAGELLRPDFPDGLQRVEPHALPVRPSDGVMLTDFGPRAARLGLHANDVIVAVDDWRVRTPDQYTMASRLKFDEQMTLTVWRDGRFRQLRLQVPQRWFGSGFRQYGGPPEQ